MNSLITHILKNNKIQDISSKINTNKNVNITLSGLTDSAKAHILYALTCVGNKSSMVGCSNIMQANKMIQDLKTVSDIEIIYFPARKLEYYEIDTESKEVENQRMYAIEKIISNEKNIIVTTVDLLTEKMYPSNTYKKLDVVIERGKNINLEEIIKNHVGHWRRCFG